MYSFMRTRQAAPAKASSPPPRPVRTRSKAASEAAAEGKEEKDDEGGGMDTTDNGDSKRSGQRLRSSSLSLGHDDFGEERKKGKREGKEDEDDEVLGVAEELAAFEFEANNSGSDGDADEPYRPPKTRHQRPSQHKQDRKEEKKDEPEEKKEEKRVKKRRLSSEEEVSEDGNHVLKWAECSFHWVCDHCNE